MGLALRTDIPARVNLGFCDTLTTPPDPAGMMVSRLSFLPSVVTGRDHSPRPPFLCALCSSLTIVSRYLLTPIIVHIIRRHVRHRPFGGEQCRQRLPTRLSHNEVFLQVPIAFFGNLIEPGKHSFF